MTLILPSQRLVLPPLRFLPDHFDQAQRIRIATGERIRAILQGRDVDAWARASREPKEKTDDVSERAEIDDAATDVSEPNERTVVRVAASR